MYSYFWKKHKGMAKLRIKEAIDHYNNNRPEGDPAMTPKQLALKVFADKNAKEECKWVLFRQIISHRRRFVDLCWLETISKETGYPADQLINFNE